MDEHIRATPYIEKIQSLQTEVERLRGRLKDIKNLWLKVTNLCTVNNSHESSYFRKFEDLIFDDLLRGGE